MRVLIAATLAVAASAQEFVVYGGGGAVTCPTGHIWGGPGDYCISGNIYICQNPGQSTTNFAQNCGQAGCYIAPPGSPDYCAPPPTPPPKPHYCNNAGNDSGMVRGGGGGVQCPTGECWVGAGSYCLSSNLMYCSSPGQYTSQITQNCGDAGCSVNFEARNPVCDYATPYSATSLPSITSTNAALPDAVPLPSITSTNAALPDDVETAAAPTAAAPETTCSPVMCMMYCENGFEKDENGCDVCQCAPEPEEPTCSPIQCRMYCENGFEKDENGCDVCQCAPEPEQPTCSPIMCMMYCENGFETDENGCDICKCAGPDLADLAAAAKLKLAQANVETLQQFLAHLEEAKPQLHKNLVKAWEKFKEDPEVLQDILEEMRQEDEEADGDAPVATTLPAGLPVGLAGAGAALVGRVGTGQIAAGLQARGLTLPANWRQQMGTGALANRFGGQVQPAVQARLQRFGGR